MLRLYCVEHNCGEWTQCNIVVLLHELENVVLSPRITIPTYVCPMNSENVVSMYNYSHLYCCIIT